MYRIPQLSLLWLQFLLFVLIAPIVYLQIATLHSSLPLCKFQSQYYLYCGRRVQFISHTHMYKFQYRSLLIILQIPQVLFINLPYYMHKHCRTASELITTHSLK